MARSQRAVAFGVYCALALVVLVNVAAADWVRKYNERFQPVSSSGEPISQAPSNWTGLPISTSPLGLPTITNGQACGRNHVAGLYGATASASTVSVRLQAEFTAVNDFNSLFVVAAGPQDGSLLWIAGCDSGKLTNTCQLQVKSIADIGGSDSTYINLTPNERYRVTATVTNSAFTVQLSVISTGQMIGQANATMPLGQNFALTSLTRFGIVLGASQAQMDLCGDNFSATSFNSQSQSTVIASDDFSSATPQFSALGTYYKAQRPGRYAVSPTNPMFGACVTGSPAGALFVPDLSSEAGFVLTAGLRASNANGFAYKFLILGPNRGGPDANAAFTIMLNCNNNNGGNNDPDGSTTCGLTARDEVNSRDFQYSNFRVFAGQSYTLVLRVLPISIQATVSQDASPANNASIDLTGLVYNLNSASSVGMQMDGNGSPYSCVTSWTIDTVLPVAPPTQASYSQDWTPVLFENFAAATGALSSNWKPVPFSSLATAHFTNGMLCGNSHNSLIRTTAFDTLPISVQTSFSTDTHPEDRDMIIIFSSSTSVIGAGCFNDKGSGCKGGIYDAIADTAVAQGSTTLPLKANSVYVVNVTFNTDQTVALIIYENGNSTNKISLSGRVTATVRNVGLVPGGGVTDTCAPSVRITSPGSGTIVDNFADQSLWIPLPAVNRALPTTTSGQGIVSDAVSMAVLDTTKVTLPMNAYGQKVHASLIFRTEYPGTGAGIFARYMLPTGSLGMMQVSCSSDNKAYCNFGLHDDTGGSSGQSYSVSLQPSVFYRIDAVFSPEDVSASLSIVGINTPVISVRAFPGSAYVDLGILVGAAADGKNVYAPWFQVERRNFAPPTPSALPVWSGYSTNFSDSLTSISRSTWQHGPIFQAASAAIPQFSGSNSACSQSLSVALLMPEVFVGYQIQATMDVYLDPTWTNDKYGAGFFAFANVGDPSLNEGALIVAQIKGSRNSNVASITVDSLGTDTNVQNTAGPLDKFNRTTSKLTVMFISGGVNVQMMTSSGQTGTFLNGRYKWSNLGIVLSGLCATNVAVDRINNNNGAQQFQRVFEDNFSSAQSGPITQNTAKWRGATDRFMPLATSTPSGVCPDIQAGGMRVVPNSGQTRVTALFSFDSIGSAETLLVASPFGTSQNAISAGVVGFANSQSPLSLVISMNNGGPSNTDPIRIPIQPYHWYAIDVIFSPTSTSVTIYPNDYPGQPQTLTLSYSQWYNTYYVGFVAGHTSDGYTGCVRDFRIDTLNAPDARCLGSTLSLIDANADRTILCDRTGADVGCVVMDAGGTVVRSPALGVDTPTSDHVARSTTGGEYGVSRVGLHYRSSSSQAWQLRAMWLCSSCAAGANNYL